MIGREKARSVTIIPLNDLFCISCRLALLCHVTQHNQDHVPREDRSLQAIPSLVQTKWEKSEKSKRQGYLLFITKIVRDNHKRNQMHNQ